MQSQLMELQWTDFQPSVIDSQYSLADSRLGCCLQSIEVVGPNPQPSKLQQRCSTMKFGSSAADSTAVVTAAESGEAAVLKLLTSSVA